MEHFYNTLGEDWFTYPALYTEMVNTFDNAKFLEVGTWKGRSVSYLAVEVVNLKKNIKIFCVDTWEGSEEHCDIIKNSNNLYNEFLNNISPVSDLIVPIKKNSNIAFNDFPDEYFDFIFIDAAHDYESVKTDLINWYSKVKHGGVFAGHDYAIWAGVAQAVDEFAKNLNLKLIVNYDEHTWRINKI